MSDVMIDPVKETNSLWEQAEKRRSEIRRENLAAQEAQRVRLGKVLTVEQIKSCEDVKWAFLPKLLESHEALRAEMLFQKSEKESALADHADSHD